MTLLKKCGISGGGGGGPDWCIVVVENVDHRSKANKLIPRQGKGGGGGRS